jgi:hypothetical protein
MGMRANTPRSTSETAAPATAVSTTKNLALNVSLQVEPTTENNEPNLRGITPPSAQRFDTTKAMNTEKLAFSKG